MIAALTLAALAQSATLDWNSLPPLPYRAPPIVTPAMHGFVAREATTRKCPLTKAGTLVIDVAVLVDEGNGIRVTVPRGVRCPTVEQYAAALVAGFARNNLLPQGNGGGERWYRTSLSFTWAK